MMNIPSAFSASYQEARVKFLNAAATAGAAIQSFAHPLKGRDGEDLAMDVALLGDKHAKRILMVSSACHGVEGYCGTGVQVHGLHDSELLQKARDAGVTLLYIHALNPHGFSWMRRVTNENVDLNRNFVDFANIKDTSKSLPDNPGYPTLHGIMLPEVWPPNAQNMADVQHYLATEGMKSLQAIVSRGQYTHPDGLFFGGQAPTWSNLTFRQVLRDYVVGAERIGWVDVHTGLGPNGYGERIFMGEGEDDAAKAELARAKSWWHSDATPITSFMDGSSTSAYLTGVMRHGLKQECANSEFTGIAMEYGTEDMLAVMTSMRGDHWLYQQDQKGVQVAPELRAAIKAAILKAFYTDTDAWKGQIISQARQAQFQAIDGLTRV
jgi:Protein of unknown function (DUF2817)